LDFFKQRILPFLQWLVQFNRRFNGMFSDRRVQVWRFRTHTSWRGCPRTFELNSIAAKAWRITVLMVTGKRC